MASTLNRDARPSRADLAAAADKLLEDVIAPGLDVLLCGINPGLWSAATGHHFARPGNRFWPALHRSGFTPRQLRPDEQGLLIGYGLGITNLAARATARADELTRDELTAGGVILRAKVERFAPAWLAVLGVTAFRTAFGTQRVQVGPQEQEFGGARLWILPNPSGLNAHFTLDRLAEEFAALRQATDHPRIRGATADAADPDSPDSAEDTQLRR
ncbi:G/U mismatch-specific DNA glycosylase [Dactylosporangium siamense]|uniref:G/U mismatch-specific DNA glycosylase n=1 Tax=Dactylosporangium siamense TaxID=685454 RepID=UPI00194342D0|nr:G/U mismatch-specific DNA glycosylase [Dactylosporangium siamense]